MTTEEIIEECSKVLGGCSGISASGAHSEVIEDLAEYVERLAVAVIALTEKAS
jgi:hypothetical protein